MIRYIIVTPVRNEEQFLPGTIEAVASQTIKPAQWIIVDDGSTDGTAGIIDRASEERPWITPVHRDDRGFRKPGGGVVDTFYRGLEHIKVESWNYIVKLDSDLSFSPDYFHRCFQYFQGEPSLGIGGGEIHNLIDGTFIPEKTARYHVRGATKIYSRACWDAIGGLIRAPGWDSLDELTANYHGFTTRTFADLAVKHYRYTGAADGTWKNQVKFGRANYICGYHPVFMFLKSVSKLFRKPVFIGTVGLLWGYFSGGFSGDNRISDRNLIKYIRREQMKKLIGRPSLWD